MTHRRAVALMVLVALLWSIAGVVTRHLEQPDSFAVTFWRSLFSALTLLVLLRPQLASGGSGRRAGLLFWVSAGCWAVMYTAFMVAMTLTSVANVLSMMALGPLLTALFARLFLGQVLPARTWLAILVAGLGIAWMFGHEAGHALSLGGMLVALLVPLGGAINWTVLQGAGRRGSERDMQPALLVGALLSALFCLPLAWPLHTSLHDLLLLALLGSVQLSLPCVLIVRLSRTLPAPEIALLGLLELVFGVAWAWLWAGEQPTGATLGGGLLVLGALCANEMAALRRRV